MSDALNNFIGWGWQRKEELLKIVFERTGGKVYQGPFKGMSILPKYSWGDGDTGGKLLGIYEDELHSAVEAELNKTIQHDIILNIGCAEGYYGLGLALRCPGIPSILFDINPAAISICRENARANNINNVQFNTDCSVENIRSYLTKYEHPLIVMDVEGHERVLLDLETIPELNKCSVIVESHDCIVQGTTELIQNNLGGTHYVHAISQGAKNPYLDILFDLCDYDKMLLCVESRPSTMTWLHLIPKDVR
jgi:hypothetical protein